MTVFEFAKICMKDADYRRGGVVKDERVLLDLVGFSYEVDDGCVSKSGEDLAAFYEALETIRALEDKYNKRRGVSTIPNTKK